MKRVFTTLAALLLLVVTDPATGRTGPGVI